MKTQPTHYSFKLYHPNANGTGSALCLGIGDDNRVELALFPQSELRLPSFKWDEPTTFRLDPVEVAKVIQVFRCECESIEDGKGIFCRTTEYASRFSMRHTIDPVCGYEIAIYRHAVRGDGEVNSRIFLSNSEALAVCLVLEGVLNNWFLCTKEA